MLEPLPGETPLGRAPAKDALLVVTNLRLMVREGSGAVSYELEKVLDVRIRRSVNPVALVAGSFVWLMLGALVILAKYGGDGNYAPFWLLFFGPILFLVGAIALAFGKTKQLVVLTTEATDLFDSKQLRDEEVAGLKRTLAEAKRRLALSNPA